MEYDLQKYRLALTMVKDLEEARKLLKVQYKELSKYKKYIPVKQVLNEILSAEIILKLHFDKNTEIIKNKGKINEA